MEHELASPSVLGAMVVAQAAAGDAVAFADIVALHHEDIALVCFVIGGDQRAAPDAVQPAAW